MTQDVLDDPAARGRIDPAGMLRSITELPEQCRTAWSAAQSFDVPADYRDIDRIAVLGMGGSAIAGDFWRVLLQRESPVPVFNVRQYDLPPFVNERTLVIASSYSGNTEETLSAFDGTDPNGVWSLYIVTDSLPFSGSMTGGWSLIFGQDPLPTPLVVTNTNDSGAGSLREAITSSNTNLGADIIQFNIGSGPKTITPLSSLPDILDPVTIDATTQPGFSGTPIIELNMSSASPSSVGLTVLAGNSSVRGLVINRFANIDKARRSGRLALCEARAVKSRTVVP